MHFAASCKKPASLYAHGSTRWQQSCSHSNAICKHRFTKRIELHTQEQPLVAEQEEPITLGITPAAPAAHRRYVSSPAEATLHGKTHGFVLRLPPQHKPHATFMQPLQCVTTSLSHHFPKSPHSLRHHFPKSPHSLCHHLPSSPLPLVSHRPSSMSILLWCVVMWCQVSHHPSSM